MHHTKYAVVGMSILMDSLLFFESCDNPGWMMNIKDPHLYRIVCSIAEKRENPDSVNICLGAAEFSEVILFSRQLQTLGHFVKNLLADNQDY